MTSTPPPEDAPRARFFGRVADAYDRARPTYPADAVAWLLGRPRARVLELGAGTGKLTGSVAAAGHQVVATDPDAEMLARLVRRVPRALALRASAERLPVASRSVDTVVAAQAFHWFDVQPALREAARVLRPGGALALVWNHRDERVPWVRRLGALMGGGEDPYDPRPAIDDSGLFETAQAGNFRFWQPLDRASLRDLVASRSSVAVLPDADRDRVLEQVDALYAEYGRGRDGLLLPYHTLAYRTRVLPWGPD